MNILHINNKFYTESHVHKIFCRLSNGIIPGIIQGVLYWTWGPFLESPGNFTGPKSNIQIEI